MKFSEQVKHLRQENHLTKEKLAETLHVSRQTVSSWENGRNLPDLEMVVMIAKTFHVSLDELILGEEAMTEKLIEDGSETTKAKNNATSFRIGLILLCIGAALFVIRAFTPEYIADDGTLVEAFFLIPCGYAFIFAGLLVFLITGVKNLIHHK